MPQQIILASGSTIRRRMLENAGVHVEVQPVRIDEAAIRDAMVAEGASPRDIADQLAEFKARRASQKAPGDIVIGCDQVLAIDKRILAKPDSAAEARAQLDALAGRKHQLLSAAVIYENAQPVWRHVGVVTLHMRTPSPGYLDDYVTRNWESIRHSVGGYKLEEEGVRLFHRIDGDYFNVLGLPLLDLLAYLTLRGLIAG
ncbi:MAG: Maf family nucleotide pyrophosphatase [Rhodobacter sp.]|nr:Maf family nucleotide pyrophosphatase [Rhodobacter sp.]